ncbi:hypothetical protein HW571_28645 [Agrobacterium genomosp. 3]|uniref:SAM-dependent methyltransferase n=1 Tax=Agrobacterium tomkonis TaxID=1183410 RepID=UPI001CD86EAF|nr:hypothetical protein [Agrobacterium tomkonis]MCA1879916.1 hypothetical protein [Agrobacterium tumefaciens]MCA1895164.1 hypothetical protein [Agrobacterium tomkonis]
MNRVCHIVGVGITSPGDITINALQRIGSAQAVVTHIDRAFLEPILAHVGGRPVLSLRGEYRDDRPRTISQDRMMLLFTEHIAAYNVLAYVTYGTPFMYDSLSVKIHDHCRRAGIDCVVTPGISSFDRVLAIIGDDIVPRFEILDADWIVSGDVRLAADHAYLLMQPAVFGTRMARRDQPSGTAVLAPLAARLVDTHGPDHPVCFVHAATMLDDKDVAHWTTVSSLPTAPDQVLRSACLYLPVVDRRLK